MGEQENAGSHSVIMVLDGSEHIVEVARGETLFAAANRYGLRPPFSCVAGVCGACAATVETGEVKMTVNLALSEKQLARGLVLTCQAKPCGSGCRVRFGDA